MSIIRTNIDGFKESESGNYGSKPHIHYFSDSSGVSKDYFISRIKSGRVPVSPVHILLEN